MKKIRKSVFETNSSSTHSLVIDDVDMLMDTLIPDEYGVVELKGGQFGWEWEKFNDAETKASYALTGIKYVQDQETALKNLEAVIEEQTLAKQVEFDCDFDPKNWDDGYIDHQSVENGEMDLLLFDREKLHNFIFNKNSWLFLGNDNSDAPRGFRNV